MIWLKQFIEYQGISTFAFEKKIGVKSTIEKAIRANTNLRSDILAKIIEVFPEINPKWLLTGTGEMLKKNIATTPMITDSYVNDLQKKLIEAQELIIELQKNQLKEAAETKKTNINN